MPVFKLEKAPQNEISKHYNKGRNNNTEIQIVMEENQDYQG